MCYLTNFYKSLWGNFHANKLYLFILCLCTQNGIDFCLQAINYQSFWTQLNKHRVNGVLGACSHTNVSCSKLLCLIYLTLYNVSVVTTIKTPFNFHFLVAFNQTYIEIITPYNRGGHDKGSRTIQQWPIIGNEHFWLASQGHLLEVFD